ncbi:MerR family transcriptional regulator [Marinobacteraceae bacterium S3BR75-40.1]
MRIGELEKRTGLSRHTIRYYEKEGVLPAPVRQANNYRVYPDSAVADLNMIRELQGMDFRLSEIRTLMAAIRSGTMDCALGAAFLREKRQAVERRLNTLRALCRQLEKEEKRLQASAHALGKTVPDRLPEGWDAP